MDSPQTIVLGLTVGEILHAALLLATIAAIIYGPIKAVQITRKLDRENEDRSRKLEVLRRLMATRMLKLSPEHVGAINLIELEFYGTDAVITPFRAYIQHLSQKLPPKDDQDHFFQTRDDLFADLLRAVAEQLGYRFDKLDLGRLGYVPVGWENEESRQRYNQVMLTQLLEGKRPLFVAEMKTAPATSPFPPVPDIEDQTRD